MKNFCILGYSKCTHWRFWSDCANAQAALNLHCVHSFWRYGSHVIAYMNGRFGTKLYRQTTGIPIGTNCAPLVADLFLFCYERDFMKYLSRDNQADIIEAFNSTSRYLDDLLNTDNIYFDQMMDRIYPTELHLNRILPIPRHLSWIWMYVYLMVQFPPKFMINGTILILI